MLVANLIIPQICYNRGMSQFDGQREGEKVELVFRRHVLTARKGFLWCFIMVALGFAPMYMWPNEPRMFWIFLGFVGLGVLGLIYSYVLWYFSIYIVTNERIRQIAQKGIFKKTVVDLGLDKIQSVACSVPGLRGSLFGYGTLLIQTGVGDLTISSVAHPEKIYNELQNLIGKVK